MNGKSNSHLLLSLLAAGLLIFPLLLSSHTGLLTPARQSAVINSFGLPSTPILPTVLQTVTPQSNSSPSPQYLPVHTSPDTAITHKEEKLHPDEDILLNENYPTLISSMRERCSVSTLLNGYDLYQKIVRNIDSTYKFPQLSIGVKLLLTYELFHKIRGFSPEITSLPDASYCTVKYALLHVEQTLQKKHTQYLKEMGLLKEFADSRKKIAYALTEKKELLQYVLQRDKEDLPNNLLTLNNWELQFEREEHTISFSEKEGEIVRLMGDIAEVKILKILSHLQSINILNNEQVAHLMQKITFVVPQSCDADKDAYYVYHVIEDGRPMHGTPTQTRDYMLKLEAQLKNIQTTEMEGQQLFQYDKVSQDNYKDVIYSDGKFLKFESIVFHISPCQFYYNVINFSDSMEHIMLHEIGHYIYHRVDTSHEQFTHLCWESTEERNDQCTNEQFISEYAQTNAHEDYAEHFAATVLENIYGYSKKGKLPPQKKDYFTNLFTSLH